MRLSPILCQKSNLLKIVREHYYKELLLLLLLLLLRRRRLLLRRRGKRRSLISSSSSSCHRNNNACITHICVGVLYLSLSLLLFPSLPPPSSQPRMQQGGWVLCLGLPLSAANGRRAEPTRNSSFFLLLSLFLSFSLSHTHDDGGWSSWPAHMIDRQAGGGRRRRSHAKTCFSKMTKHRRKVSSTTFLIKGGS